MKLVLRLNLVVLLTVCWFGCGPKYQPMPPPSGEGDCKTACATAKSLGGCGEDMDHCEQNCQDSTDKEAKIGIRHPNGCLTAAKSCDERHRCK